MDFLFHIMINIRLELNDEFLYPVNDKSNYFIDYAGEYYGKTIPKNTKNTYSLVLYEVVNRLYR